MTRLNILRINQRLLIVSFGLVLLQTPVVVWLWSQFPNQALIFKSVADVLILTSAAISLYLLITNWQKIKIKKMLWGMLAAYFGVTLLASLITIGQWQSLMAGLLIDLRYILVLFSSLVVAGLDKTWADRLTKIWFVFGFLVGLVALLQATVLPNDFLSNFGYSAQTIQPYLLIDQNDNYVRFGSTLRGPNPLGALAVIILALAISRFYSDNKIKQADKFNLGLIVLAAIALLVSYSRSAWLAAGLVVGICLVYYYRSRRRLVIGSVLIGVICVILALGVLILKDDNHSLMDEFQHLFLHDNVATSHINSDQERENSILTAVNLIKDRPILGHGVGSAGSASLMRKDGKEIIIENQFLFVAYETGLLGLLLFVGLYSVILLQLFRLRASWLAFGLFVSGLGLAAVGLFLPVFVDSAVAVSWWGLAGAAIGGISYNKKHNATRH